MKYLMREWLNGRGLPLSSISKEQGKQLAYFLAIFHDIGKSSITFQTKITENSEDLKMFLKNNDLNVVSSINDPELRGYKELPHGAAGEIFMLLKGCPSSISSIIGAHHGKPFSKGEEAANEIFEVFEEYESQDEAIMEIYRNSSFGLRLWGNGVHRKQWLVAQNEFYEWAAKEINLININELPEVADNDAFILSGLLIMADWIASNEDYFPLIEYKQSAPEDFEKREKEAWQKISLPKAWNPVFYCDYKDLMKKRFGFYPNSVQENVMKILLQTEQMGLMILEAPTGIGKTEAALLIAEELSGNRAKGVMFALPTQATANGIFTRVLEWGNSQERALSIHLAHGMASMNKEYQQLQGNENYSESAIDDYESNHLIVHDFFNGRKQALLADLVVGTVDQVLLAGLKQKHVMLRHLGLCGKVVIIDECHAYDTYMNEYLERVLEWLGSYNTPVIMLSATLPYERRSALVDAYMGNKNINADLPWRKSLGYPLLTVTDKSGVHQYEIGYKGTSKEVKITKIKCENEIENQINILISALTDKMKNGGCSGIVVNTVRRAQNIASIIKKRMPEKKVLLLHSSFIAPDRHEKESELLNLLGKKSGKKERDGVILIGTQVIEQSLDYDVDFMVTDLCPMDLLLQRIGRLHRHSIHDSIRPEEMKDPQCYILGLGEELDRGGIAVYGEYLLMRTKEFIPEVICIPQDIALLTQKTYNEEYQLTNISDKYLMVKEKEKIKKDELKRNADAFRIPSPNKERTIHHLLDTGAITDEDFALAQVRSGKMSPEVLVLFNGINGVTRRPWKFQDRLDLRKCLDNDMCKEIAEQNMRLPSWITDQINMEELKMPEMWSNSVWLKNRSLLILDLNGEKCIGSLKVKYSDEYGLIIERGNV